MKRTVSILSVLSLAFFMTVVAFGQTSAKPQHLSKQQLSTLIATAKTPAEHRRIAQFYQSQVQDYLAQSKEHEAMVAAYKSNGIYILDSLGHIGASMITSEESLNV